MLLHNKTKKNKGNRLLVSINVVRSAGPIRFLVNEDDLVASVIDTALKSYAREGRLPVLGSDFNDFFLYCPMYGPEALDPWASIGSLGARNFMLCKKPEAERHDNARSHSPNRKVGSWKSWINRSLSLKIYSH